MKTGPKRKDLTGQQFGQWTVVSYSHSCKRASFWLCRCVCGTEKPVNASGLRTEHSKSCGCMSIPKLLNIKFGRLLVTKDLGFRRLPNRKYDTHFYLCLCDCGVEKEVPAGDLTSENTKSCGCYNKQRLADLNRLPSGEASFTCLYHGYKTRAKERGYGFDLSKEQVRTLTKSPCYYCGEEPKQVKFNTRQSTPYVYNGMDRVNNDIGYTFTNSVPCCKICNTAKMDRTLEEFLAWVQRVSNFQNLKETVKPVGENK